MNTRPNDSASATGSPPSRNTTTQPSTRSNEPVGPNDGPALTQRAAPDASRGTRAP